MALWSLVNLASADDPSASVQLGWDANPESDIAGYRVQYGTTSGNLAESLTVGPSPEATLTQLATGIRYFCAVRAFTISQLEGPLSSEISFVLFQEDQSGPPHQPEISVEQSSGNVLGNGHGPAIDFGTVTLGSIGTPETITIKNVGTADLTGLEIISDSEEFFVDSPGTSTLASGDSTHFTVGFRPLSAGSRKGGIHITSDDGDDRSFDIPLVGSGIALPSINIYQDDGTGLVSGSGSVNFGNGNLGSTTPTRTFTIKNSGSGTLSGLSVACDGADFNLTSPGPASLASGASTTFKVAFAPSAPGSRSTHLIVSSNDADKRTFLITLTGNGIEVPEIVVELGNGKNLIDENSFINFGTVDVGSTCKSQIFTIRNIGTGKLDGLSIIKNGISPSEFSVGALNTRHLAAGASTTFKVNFSPARSGIRWAAIHVTSSDADEKYFDIVLTGSGKRPSNFASPPPGFVGTKTLTPVSPVISFEMIGGRRFLTLSIVKTPGRIVLPSDVEVSADLLTWSSGQRHTSLLLNNVTTLKVRDNTPISGDTKRYIRLKR